MTDVIDPLGGSYYLEWLTNEMEEQAYSYFEKIEQIGGVLEAIKQGFIQREIANTSYHKTKELESGKRFIVGVNKYEVNEEKPIDYLKVNQALRRKAVAKLRTLKKGRDERRVSKSLEALRKTFEDPNANSIYPMLDAVRSYATLQEIMDVGRDVFGGWKEPMIA